MVRRTHANRARTTGLPQSLDLHGGSFRAGLGRRQNRQPIAIKRIECGRHPGPLRPRNGVRRHEPTRQLAKGGPRRLNHGLLCRTDIADHIARFELACDRIEDLAHGQHGYADQVQLRLGGHIAGIQAVSVHDPQVDRPRQFGRSPPIADDFPGIAGGTQRQRNRPTNQTTAINGDR